MLADVPTQMERKTDTLAELRNNPPMLGHSCHKVNCVKAWAPASALFLCGPHEELSSKLLKGRVKGDELRNRSDKNSRRPAEPQGCLRGDLSLG